MSTSLTPRRPLACLKQALRQCRMERQQQRRQYALRPSEETKEDSSSLLLDAVAGKAPYPLPTAGFRPSQAIKQNRFNTNLKPIRNFPHEPSSRAACIDPVKAITEQQLKVLDPKGVRTRLFSAANPERVQPGDILLVRLKSGDPFSGVCITIRRRNSPIDTAILLRNALTRVGVEMWYKVYSPNVEGIEIVQRAQRKARRNKLTYMRKPKHDMGSVEKIVQAYQKNRVGGPSMGSSQSRNRKGKEGGGKQAKKN